MRTFVVLALAAMVFFSCKKGQGIHLVPGPTDSTDIVGEWKLEASRIGFAIANHDTTWRLATTTATISFSSSGQFASDAGYVYKDEQYDRYSADPLLAGQFRLVATVPPSGSFPIYHARVELINQDQLVISYMGVDYTPQELYIRK